MNLNMGILDRVIRLVVGAALVILPFTYFQSYFQNTVILFAAVAIGSIFLITSVVGLCPLYSLFGFSTKSKT